MAMEAFYLNLIRDVPVEDDYQQSLRKLTTLNLKDLAPLQIAEGWPEWPLVASA